MKHINLIADRLEAAMKGKVLRLIFNLPPRSMKSICISVAWPAWILGNDPSAKIIVASYSQLLSEKHSADTRYIIQSEWYKELFPNVKIIKDQNTKHKFVTTSFGYRFATSICGTITGEGGKYIIVDDPITPMQSDSETYMKRVANWFDQSLITRLDDKKRGVVVLVMQRLHVKDLSGHLISKKGNKWHVVSLPMIAERNERFYSSVNHWKYVKKERKRNLIFKRKIGELLYPTRESFKQVEMIKLDMGSAAFLAQYQQNPLPSGSNFLNMEWFLRYTNIPDEREVLAQSWDTAGSSCGSFSVCTTWLSVRNNYYLMDVIRIKGEYPVLKETFLNASNHWKPDVILIENKSSGQQLIQEFRDNIPYPIIHINVSSDKLSRFKRIVPVIEARRVFLPLDRSWLGEFEKEIVYFPFGKHSDQVDSMTQFLTWSQENSACNFSIKYL